MKKICFVLEHFLKNRIGGAESQAYYIAKEIAKYFDIHYIFFDNSNDFSERKIEKYD